MPDGADEVVEESREIAARQAKRKLDAQTPQPSKQRPQPKVPRDIPAMHELVARVRRDIPLPGELAQLRDDQSGEVLEYAFVNRNRFNVKGVLAEQLIERNPKFAELMAGIRSRLVGDLDWDRDSVQYVRRSLGVAPSETTAGEFADLADGFVIALSRDPNATKRVNILAVFEAKSPRNTRDLAFGKEGDMGQVGLTLERLGELPINIEVKAHDGSIQRWTLDPGEFTYSPRREERTHKRLIIPKGHALTDREVARVREAFPQFDPDAHLWRHTVDDATLQQAADKIAALMDKEFPKPKPARKKGATRARSTSKAP